MNAKMTVLSGALLFALSGAAIAEQPSPATQGTASQATSQPTPTVTPTDPSTHGSTVSEVAREQGEAGTPPETPPGATVSQVAQGQGDWMRLDSDRDGILSDAEIQADASLASALDAYDSDGDGQLTRAEFDSYLRASADGSLSADVDVEGDLGEEGDEFE